MRVLKRECNCALCEDSVSNSGVRRCKIEGTGPKIAKVMIVGQCPGSDEVEQGAPFVGRAGELLNDMLREALIPREELYFTNVVKCRPSVIAGTRRVDRDPKPQEINACLPMLIDEIRTIRPAVIVSVGNIPMRVLTGISGVMMWQTCVMFHRLFQCWIVPMIHPSALLRWGATQGLDFDLSVIALSTAWEYRDRRVRITRVIRHFVQDASEAEEIVVQCVQHDAFAFDFETYLNGSLRGLGLCWRFCEAYYIPAKFLTSALVSRLARDGRDSMKIAHNVAFDRSVARWTCGVELGPKVFDTMIAHHLLEEEMPYGLKDLEWLYTDKGGRADLIKPHYGKPTWDRLPEDVVGEYCCDDVESTFRLYHRFKKELAREGLEYLFENVSMPTTRVVEELEHNGVPIDESAMTAVTDRCLELEELSVTRVRKIAGDFNVNSGQQLGDILYVKLKLPEQHTKTKRWKTDGETLKKLKPLDRSGIIDEILNIKKQRKILSTYIKGTRKRMRNGRAYYSFLQPGTVTGRLSSAFHTFPRNAAIRRIIGAPSGRKLIDADFDQIELRIGASLSGDPEMIRVFREGGDIHNEVACTLYGLEPGSEVDVEQRNTAKGFDFGVFFGRGASSVADEMGVSLQKAQEWIDRFARRFAVLWQWIDQQHVFVREHLYVRNLYGRRRQLKHAINPDTNMQAEAERQAVNAPIQGGANDIACIAWERIRERVQREKLDAKLCGIVHDEILVETDDASAEYVALLMKEEMEKPYPRLLVPMTADVHIVQNWYEHKASKTIVDPTDEELQDDEEIDGVDRVLELVDWSVEPPEVI